MSELPHGRLKVTPRKGKPPLVQVEIDGKLFTPTQSQLSSNLTPTEGLDVEFVRVGGQPQQVRPVGQEFVSQSTRQSQNAPNKANASTQPRQSSRQHSPKKESKNSGRQVRQGQPPRDFHNPYNFVPAPPRNINHPELGDQGDHPLVHQDQFAHDRYSGRIRVRMTSQTPILVPDTDPASVREETNGHKTFCLRVDTDGLPAIPSSSVRGMLRAAYEAITNSRFGRFASGHKAKLRYRASRPPYKTEYPASPWDLLHPTLLPAASADELSPADRVFGWVRADTASQSEEGQPADRVAVRGALRVGPIVCESAVNNAVELFEMPGVPLAILSTPKPEQGRFYVAKTHDGEAQDDDLSKVSAGYSLGKGLRGRKVYPHQRALAAAHWENPIEDRSQTRSSTGDYQEYRRPRNDGGEQRDDQNRSILGWVKPSAEFTFDLYVQNLSIVELGALLWLLTLPAEHYLRLGGGKPLAFGSVRLTIDGSDLRTGDQLRSRFLAWNNDEPVANPSEKVVLAFKEAVSDAYSRNEQSDAFDDVPFIRAFLLACRGYSGDLPVHYPRATSNGPPGPPNPDGESFKWFVANEKEGAQYALPDLEEGIGLPTLSELPNRAGRSRKRS